MKPTSGIVTQIQCAGSNIYLLFLFRAAVPVKKCPAKLPFHEVELRPARVAKETNTDVAQITVKTRAALPTRTLAAARKKNVFPAGYILCKIISFAIIYDLIF